MMWHIVPKFTSMETVQKFKIWGGKKKKKEICMVSQSKRVSMMGYILDSTRLSGRVFVEADITKYGPLEEIKCSYQEVKWSLPSQTNLLLLSCAPEPSEILFATLAHIFHGFPFCLSNRPRKLTTVTLFSPHSPSSCFTPHPHFPLQQSLHIFLGGIEIHLYRLIWF